MDRRARTADTAETRCACRHCCRAPTTPAGVRSGRRQAALRYRRIGYRLREGTNWCQAGCRTALCRRLTRRCGRCERLRGTPDRGGNWQDVWRSTSIGSAILPASYPAALRLSLTLANGEQYQRVFALRDVRS
jgi:hypothetical protein